MRLELFNKGYRDRCTNLCARWDKLLFNNLSIIIRFILIFSLFIINNFDSISKDLYIVVIMFMYLILSLSFKTNKIKDFILDSIFWILCVFFIYSWKIYPINSNPIIYIIMIRIIVLGISFIKLKDIYTNNSIIESLWVISLFMFLCEFSLNSTFGLSGFCLLTTILSSFYSIFRILKVH